MITVRVGNLLDSDSQTLVNTVNCVGVMGKGIALDFKKQFPAMFDDYDRRCKANNVQLGKPYIFGQLGAPSIVNFPTKDHWRSSSTLSDIITGLDYLESHYRDWGITSIAVPPLGCGNGGLDWAIVGPTLYQHLARLDVPVELYAPLGTPESELTDDYLRRSVESPTANQRFKLPAAAVALAMIVERVDRSPSHWPVGKTIFQKIAYFATEAGIETGLEFRRGSYGPFSPQLSRFTTRLVNNGVIKERRLGRMISISPGEGYASAVSANRDKLDTWDSAIDRVADLFLRIPRTAEAEVVATVKFIANELQSSGAEVTEEDIWNRTVAWKGGRLTRDEVARTIRDLNELGWLGASYSPGLAGTDDLLD